MMDITMARKIAKRLESGDKAVIPLDVKRAFWKLESIKARTVEERRENMRLAQICFKEVGSWKD